MCIIKEFLPAGNVSRWRATWHGRVPSSVRGTVLRTRANSGAVGRERWAGQPTDREIARVVTT